MAALTRHKTFRSLKKSAISKGGKASKKNLPGAELVTFIELLHKEKRSKIKTSKS
ncbi:MAG: hypothetical protein ACK458_19215 [Sphingobacteriales bacterium]|jgi:hypothetical protein